MVTVNLIKGEKKMLSFQEVQNELKKPFYNLKQVAEAAGVPYRTLINFMRADDALASTVYALSNFIEGIKKNEIS
jgi:predicted transcriptional regulator